SSSDSKLDRARKLGAEFGINYNTHPDWDKEVQRLTNGRGVDHVVEVGGVATLARSYQSIGFGGKIALIGFLAGMKGQQEPYALMMKGGSLHGVGVGSTAMFEEMNRAIEVNGIKPVVDRVFAFDETPEALRQFAAGNFFGKIVIAV
ncbi:MAG TPA: zinc-binding dehydrogenase, partial [Bryobacteraceae bacterium]|nr:zinc-binding dehydrogenase [Bryobacteraceae bacterium]